MALVVLQRYVLVANGPVTSVPASGSLGTNALTAVVPLSGRWTIRLAFIGGAAYSQDNSGSLTLDSLNLTWQLLSSSGAVLFSLLANRSIISPAAPFAKILGQAFTDAVDTNQVISSLDQLGGVVAGIQGSMNASLLNSDAANPHSVQGQVNAILEFLLPGSF